jgi:hypothetical protein
MTATPRLEIIIVRDPDGGTYVHPYVDGAELEHTQFVEYVIDAGAGHNFEDWIQKHDRSTTRRSPKPAPRSPSASASNTTTHPVPGKSWVAGHPDTE